METQELLNSIYACTSVLTDLREGDVDLGASLSKSLAVKTKTKAYEARLEALTQLNNKLINKDK